MGIHENINYDRFPEQGSFLNKKVEVCFHYNTTKLISGIIVRDDNEEPYLTIIKLDSGKYVLARECQYSVL
ncbi:MAG: hypothetical protein ACE5RH_03430 [Nitrosarchaeum sp.]